MKYLLLPALLIIVTFFFVTTQVHSSSEQQLKPTQFSHYLQGDFGDYVLETKQWLREHRVFRGDDPELEVELNAPFEIKPERPTKKGVLLIHGLSDSPYSFIDIAERLSKEGFMVRTVLLPGHGAKPADLMLPKIDDWLSVVSHHTDLFLEQVDEVWLGGFSTGANLAVIEAIDNTQVNGTLLFSPAFVSSKTLDFLAPWAKYVLDWADVDPEVNIVRFDSLTMNGAALYYKTSAMVRERLAQKAFDRPTVFVLSEHDNVINVDAAYQYFQTRFQHGNKQVVWLGDRQWGDPLVSSYSMALPEKRISTGSHMSVLYAPNNPFYGEQGSIRICNNGQPIEAEKACEAGSEVWFSSFDYIEAGKIHARLTWNPYFDETVDGLLSVMNASHNTF